MNVTCATLAATLKALGVATSIAVTGPCGAHITLNAAPVGTVLDFSAATVATLDLVGLNGVTVRGLVSTSAQYSALNVVNSSQILISTPHIVTPGTSGITIQGSDTIEIAGPWITESAGDGVDIAGSTNINIHDGSCEDEVVKANPAACVEEWSVTGHPLLHVFVQNMVTIGQTQGFKIIDQQNLGATDIEFLNNHVAISTPTCISSSFTQALVITGNDCHTLPGSPGSAVITVTNSPGAIVNGNTPSQSLGTT